VKVACKSHPGRRRSSNEDCVLADRSIGLFIVADGLGGHNAGEVASAVAVHEVHEHVLESLAKGGPPERVLRESVFVAHRRIQERAEIDPELTDMGTTIVMALWNRDHFLICHVGDSRAYLIVDGRIRPLTTDHSFIAEWLREGVITPAEARIHVARHGLTMAVGVDEEIEPVIACLPWDRSGWLLLCSDGLTDMVEDQELLDIIAQAEDPQAACDRLVAQANEKGGKDNISVLLVCE
jgi:PPM family protein phosphatase